MQNIEMVELGELLDLGKERAQRFRMSPLRDIAVDWEGAK